MSHRLSQVEEEAFSNNTLRWVGISLNSFVEGKHHCETCGKGATSRCIREDAFHACLCEVCGWWMFCRKGCEHCHHTYLDGVNLFAEAKGDEPTMFRWWREYCERNNLAFNPATWKEDNKEHVLRFRHEHFRAWRKQRQDEADRKTKEEELIAEGRRSRRFNGRALCSMSVAQAAGRVKASKVKKNESKKGNLANMDSEDWSMSNAKENAKAKRKGQADRYAQAKARPAALI